MTVALVFRELFAKAIIEACGAVRTVCLPLAEEHLQDEKQHKD